MKKLILLSFVLLAFISCDEIDDPIPKDIGQAIEYQGTTYVIDQSLGIGNVQGLLDLIDNNTWTTKSGTDNSSKRVIVIEEFTGHKCIFCPQGTEEILRLDSIHGESLIPVSIHAGGFATPEDGKYSADYRVPPHGDAYLREFGVDGYPTALISRLGAEVQKKDNWGILVDSLIDDVPFVELRLQNFYSEASNIVRVDLNAIFKVTPQRNYSLQLFMLEDHIVNWQKDFRVSGGDIQSYDHRHMLRKVVNGTYGTALEGVQENVEIKYQFILPLESGWKPQDVESVAYIFDNDPTSFEIVQGNAAKVK